MVDGWAFKPARRCRPGGLHPVPVHSRTRSNNAQNRADNHDQLATSLASAAKSLGIASDWVAIGEDALQALRVGDLSEQIDPLWRWPSDHNLLPGHVVCSTLAATLHDLPVVGWPHPDLGQERQCAPADWWRWSAAQSWA